MKLADPEVCLALVQYPRDPNNRYVSGAVDPSCKPRVRIVKDVNKNPLTDILNFLDKDHVDKYAIIDAHWMLDGESLDIIEVVLDVPQARLVGPDVIGHEVLKLDITKLTNIRCKISEAMLDPEKMSDAHAGNEYYTLYIGDLSCPQHYADIIADELRAAGWGYVYINGDNRSVLIYLGKEPKDEQE